MNSQVPRNKRMWGCNYSANRSIEEISKRQILKFKTWLAQPEEDRQNVAETFITRNGGTTHADSNKDEDNRGRSVSVGKSKNVINLINDDAEVKSAPSEEKDHWTLPSKLVPHRAPQTSKFSPGCLVSLYHPKGQIFHATVCTVQTDALNFCSAYYDLVDYNNDRFEAVPQEFLEFQVSCPVRVFHDGSWADGMIQHCKRQATDRPNYAGNLYEYIVMLIDSPGVQIKTVQIHTRYQPPPCPQSSSSKIDAMKVPASLQQSDPVAACVFKSKVIAPRESESNKHEDLQVRKVKSPIQVIGGIRQVSSDYRRDDGDGSSKATNASEAIGKKKDNADAHRCDTPTITNVMRRKLQANNAAPGRHVGVRYIENSKVAVSSNQVDTKLRSKDIGQVKQTEFQEKATGNGQVTKTNNKQNLQQHGSTQKVSFSVANRMSCISGKGKVSSGTSFVYVFVLYSI